MCLVAAQVFGFVAVKQAAWPYLALAASFLWLACLQLLRYKQHEMHMRNFMRAHASFVVGRPGVGKAWPPMRGATPAK